MTNTQNPDSTNSQGNQQGSLNRLIQSIKRNKMVLIGATLAGLMSNFIGFIVDIVEFNTLINPKPTDVIDQWALVKITGWSVGSYDSKKLNRTSKFTALIYTDYQVADTHLKGGTSPVEDFSVLKNVDYIGKLPEDAKTKANSDKKTVKTNSQTIQARLIQASKNEEPVCLRVYGIRDNSKSQFSNIVQLIPVKQETQNKYNDLKNQYNSLEDYKKLSKCVCSDDKTISCPKDLEKLNHHYD